MKIRRALLFIWGKQVPKSLRRSLRRSHQRSHQRFLIEDKHISSFCSSSFRYFSLSKPVTCFVSLFCLKTKLIMRIFRQLDFVQWRTIKFDRKLIMINGRSWSSNYLNNIQHFRFLLQSFLFQIGFLFELERRVRNDRFEDLAGIGHDGRRVSFKTKSSFSN